MSDVKVRQIGHLAAKPEVTFVGEGESRTARCYVAVLSNKRYKGRDGERQERTTRVGWTLWGTMAENAGKYLDVGAHVAVEGRMENHSYEKNGETVYRDDFVAEELEYLDSKAESEARAAQARAADTPAAR